MKASILAALLLAGAFPAAAQTNNPDVPIPRVENQLRRQNQIEDLRTDQQKNALAQQQETARLQERIDSLNSPPDDPDAPSRLNDADRVDLNRLQQALDRLQNEQQQQRLAAERRIGQIERQGDTARRRRWAAQFAREQEAQRLQQRQRLADIEEGLKRFSGK